MQAEDERRHDAEVAAAAAEGPEEVGILVGAGGDALAAGQHDVGRQRVVDRQPVLARQVAVAAAEREAADPGGGDDAADRREPVLVRGAIDVAPRAPPPTRAVRAAGSTSTSRIGERSMTTPSSTMPPRCAANRRCGGTCGNHPPRLPPLA
jgi:hypothetical protein